jgi:hypothetical protein
MLLNGGRLVMVGCNHRLWTWIRFVVHPAPLLTVLVYSAACGSSGKGRSADASVHCEVECDGDQECSPAGKCVSRQPDGAAPEVRTNNNGDPCVISGSDCNPSCLESCGVSSTCVDLCCPDTKSTGVYCGGQCVSPECTKGQTPASLAAFAERGWACYEVTVAGSKACDCTNGSTAAELQAEGKTIVPTCSGASCSIDLDAPDLDCHCRATGSSHPVSCPGTNCVASVPACTGPFTFSCDDPCVGLTVHYP